ncbi:MAG: hypothetical protein ACI86M_003050 [Saprospiraceae bacterium]|jgi:hypothetical protein
MFTAFFEACRADPEFLPLSKRFAPSKSAFHALFMPPFCNDGFSAIALLYQSFRPCWYQVPKLKSRILEIDILKKGFHKLILLV